MRKGSAPRWALIVLLLSQGCFSTILQDEYKLLRVETETRVLPRKGMKIEAEEVNGELRLHYTILVSCQSRNVQFYQYKTFTAKGTDELRQPGRWFATQCPSSSRALPDTKVGLKCMPGGSLINLKTDVDGESQVPESKLLSVFARHSSPGWPACWFLAPPALSPIETQVDLVENAPRRITAFNQFNQYLRERFEEERKVFSEQKADSYLKKARKELRSDLDAADEHLQVAKAWIAPFPESTVHKKLEKVESKHTALVEKEGKRALKKLERERRKAEARGECDFSGYDDVGCELKLCASIARKVRAMEPRLWSCDLDEEPMASYREQWTRAIEAIDAYAGFLNRDGDEAGYNRLVRRIRKCKTPNWFRSCTNLHHRITP